MKTTLSRYTVVLASLVIVVSGVGVLAALRGMASKRSDAVASRQTDAAFVLPAPTHASKSDSEVTKWMVKAQQEPKSERAWVNLGDALMQKARETMDASYYGHAERAYQKTLALNARNADAANGMAWVNGGWHEFEKSIDWAQKAIALDSQDQEAYGLWGDADVEMGDYDAAYRHYQQMLDIRPNLASYSRGAHLLFLMGDQRKARWLMSKAVLAGGPYAENTVWCRVQLGLMLLDTGALLPAEQVFNETLNVAPHNLQLLMAMGKLRMAQQKYPEAIDYYQQAVAIAPMHDALVALGDLYTLTGKPQEAEKQYALVETIHKLLKANGVQGDMQIAQFYADHDRNLPDALKEAEAEFATRKNVAAADTLAWCYYKNGRYEDAEKTIQLALKQHTPDARFHFHAGMIAAKRSDVVTAKKELYEALSINSRFHPTQAKLASDTLIALGSQPRDTAARTVPASLSGGR